MISFKINFLTFLNSTAMTLLFLSPVSAMEEEWEKHDHLLEKVSPPMRGSSASSSIGFEQIEEEKAATKLRSNLNLAEPEKLFLFEDHRFIKGEVSPYGSCFIDTLKMLFPGRGISRIEFAARLNSAFKGEDPAVSKEDIRREFAAELYTQLNEYKVNRGKEVRLEFGGEEINKLSMRLLNETPHDYFDLPQNGMDTIRNIAADDKIIEEMLVAYAQPNVYLSLPAGKENIGSFGLACKLFGINLDIYAPIYDQPNSLYKRKKFRFGDASLPPQPAFYLYEHVNPLCLEDNIETRIRFALNDQVVAKLMAKRAHGVSSSVISDSTSQSDPLSFVKEEINFPWGESYLSCRLNLEKNSAQYATHMPPAPVVHPYEMGFDYPSFPYAARLSAKELNPRLFPAIFEVREILQNQETDPETAEYFYVVQNNPWKLNPQCLLRPQSWVFPDAPYSLPVAYSKSEVLKVEILSPNNSTTLTGPSEGVISSHNGKDSNGKGNPVVISSGSTFPMLSGVKANQTSFFVSTVVVPSTKRAAVTFHTILSDDDFGLLQTAAINNLRDLQSWLVNLFQSKYGATSDGSSPYSNWTTGAVSATPVKPAVSAPSTSAVASQGEERRGSEKLMGSAFGINPFSLNFNSTFETERGSSIPQGWTLHDGRKGRVGEERTEANPLQVKVIGDGKIKITGDMYNYFYSLPELKNFAGQEMRFSAKVKSTVPGTRLAYMGKRGNQINSAPHSNREGEEVISLIFVVDSDPTSLNNLYFLGGRAREGILPYMEIQDVELHPLKPVSFNSTFETEGGSSLPQGWTLHDGRKGRTGEERIAENPLQVEVIGDGKIKIIGDMYNFYYPLPELKNFAGKEMRFSAKVKSTVPGTRLAYMGKRGNQINSDPHSNREGEEIMSFTFKVDSDPTSLNNLYFLGGRAKERTPPSMEISDVKLEPVGEKN